MGVAERRERERGERRTQIVDAAERVFEACGASNATMDQVAAAAELSKGTLYLYFRNKDDLYLAMAERLLTSLLAELEQLEPNGATGHARFASHLEKLHAVVSKKPTHMKTLLAWMTSGFHADAESPTFAAYQSLVARMMSRIVAVIALGREDGSIRADIDPILTVMHVWGGTMGTWMLYFNQDEVRKRFPVPVDFDALVPSFHAGLLRSLEVGA